MIEFFCKISIAFPITFSVLGTSLGQGIIGKRALIALYSQPEDYDKISRACTIGSAISETASVLGLVISIILLLNKQNIAANLHPELAYLGIVLPISISGFISGLFSSIAVSITTITISKQPFFKNKINNLTLIMQMLSMTPNLFGFLISILLISKLKLVNCTQIAIQFLAAGIAMGFGSIGSLIGLSLFTHAAIDAIGKNKDSYKKILSLTFINEAIIETPVIFSLIISLLIINTKIETTSSFLRSIALLSAGICIAISSLTPGICTGFIGAKACSEISENPNSYSAISKISLLASALIDTFPIYGLVISILLVYLN